MEFQYPKNFPNVLLVDLIENQFIPRLTKIVMKDLFSKILVCVDGSKQSDKALDKAISLAEKFKCELYLINVIEKSTIDFWDNSEYVGITSKFLKKRKDNIKKKYKKKIKEFSKNINYKLIVSEGDIMKEIIKLVKKRNIDLIVVGNRGLGEFSKILLGSVSNKLVNQSPCSIMIIK